ncbi:MAG TPA: hypothetical protein VGZ52_06185 [Acidimicrobiales bacterium]|jgi:hypothetical protein|nr:hypothetical protein [Acidimicrobiales bacterium]
MRSESIPVACTLDAEAMPERVKEWDRVLTHSCSRERLASGAVRVEFTPDIRAADLAALVESEQQCCAFFEFVITIDARGLGLEVTAPDDAAALVSAMFDPKA